MCVTNVTAYFKWFFSYCHKLKRNLYVIHAVAILVSYLLHKICMFFDYLLPYLTSGPCTNWRQRRSNLAISRVQHVLLLIVR